MSYDLVFWNQGTDDTRTPETIYNEICEFGSSNNLVEYNPNQLVNALKKCFQSVQIINNSQIDWDPNDNSGSFLAAFTVHHIIFNCYRLTGSQMNDIIDAAVSVGLRLYDPQENKRF